MNGGVHIDDPAVAECNLSRRLLQKHFACRPFPARIVIGKKLPNVALTQRPQHRIANGMHQHIGIGMPVQAHAMRNIHAAKDQFASRRQRMHIITDSNMNHCRTIGTSPLATKLFVDWTHFRNRKSSAAWDLKASNLY